MRMIIKKYINIFLIVFPSIVSSQSLQEIEKLKSEYSKILERQSLQKSVDIQEAESRAKSIALPDKLVYSRKDVESLLVNTQKLLEELKFLKDTSDITKYIGYEIFSKRDSIPFWQNLPVPKAYKLGPGDEVVISLWGEVNLHVNETINRDGQIYVEKIGILYLGDKTLESAKEYVFKRLSKLYSTLSNDKPKTFFDLSLGDLKSLNVHFVGYVNLPGIHMIHPFSNVINSLLQAGGVQNKGSLRNIQLIRDGQIIAKVDIYNYLFYGKSISDIKLLDQDVVYIPPRNNTVAVTGQVLKPGYFESIENESLDRIIDYAGGFNYTASKQGFLYRKSTKRQSFLIDLNEKNEFNALDGDSIFIPKKIEVIDFIEISGQVKNPGKYPFFENINLKKLINLTQSLDDEEFLKTIDFENIILTRKNENGKAPTIIKLDYDEDTNLKNRDRINVGLKEYNKPLKNVKITGEIVTPGLYPLSKEATLEDLLQISGGYTADALVDGIEIFRDSVKIAWENNNFILSDNDSLHVLQKSGLILVKGEVNSPGYISYKKRYTIKKYINLAGGYSPFAQKSDVYIIYPNGTAVPLSRFRSPKVKEGSTIIINERMISNSSSQQTGWQIFSSLTSQAGNIATTLLTISILANQTSGQ